MAIEVDNLCIDDIFWMDKIHFNEFNLHLNENDFNLPYKILGVKNISYVIYTEVDTEIEIIYIAVEKSYRRKGYAKQLINSLSGDIYIDVSEKNEVAIRFYNSMGFVKYGCRKNYYSDGNNAILMKRSKDVYIGD